MTLDVQSLKDQLVQETGRLCGHQERKGKLSMSTLYLPIEELLKRYQEGHIVDDKTKLKLFQGTHAEIGVRNRLRCLAFANMWKYEPPTEISAFEGRLTGHIDGVLGGHLIEIKTVPSASALEDIRTTNRVPNKVFWQVNAYMLWGRYPDCYVIYETRAEGEICIVEVRPNRRIQEEMREKAQKLLQLVGD